LVRNATAYISMFVLTICMLQAMISVPNLREQGNNSPQLREEHSSDYRLSKVDCFGKNERHRERERDTERERETERETERDRERERERETERDRHREIERETHTHTHTQTEREREREREREKVTYFLVTISRNLFTVLVRYELIMS